MFAFLGAIAAAATVSVGPGQDFEDLLGVADLLSDGDVVEVHAGTYSQQLDLYADVKFVAVDGPEVTILTGGHNEAMIRVYADVTLDGFTITSEYERHCIRVWEGNFVLANGVVERCQPTDGLGGGLRSDPGTTVRIENTTFQNNITDHPALPHIAAHVYSRSDSLEVYDSIFDNGVADDGAGEGLQGDGASVYAINGVVRIERSSFTNNIAGDDAGGVYLFGGPTDAGVGYDFYTPGVYEFYLKDCLFVGNSSGDRGGALFLSELPHAEIEHNTFIGNAAGYLGGAVYVDEGVGLHRFTNNVFSGNEAVSGGAVYLLGTDGAFRYNHFVDNSASDSGGAIGLQLSDASVVGNLFAYNSGAAAVLLKTGTLGALDYNLWFDTSLPIGGAPIGANDVEADPLFLAWSDDGDGTNDDLHFGSGSPGIDAGDLLDFDTDGSRADIGAYGGEAIGTVPGGTTPPTEGTETSETSETGGTTDPADPTADPGGDPPQYDTPLAGAGCACDQAATPSWMGLFALALIFRGRRPTARR